MAFSALCVGQATVELVGAMPVFPVHAGQRQELSAFALQGGGAAATAAVTLAKLGVKTAFGGVLPDDFLGDFAAAGLADAGVELALLKRQEGGVTPVSFSAVDEQRRRRTVFFTRGACDELLPGEIRPAALDGVGLLLVDGSSPEAQLILVEAARSRGVKTLLSAHMLSPGMAQLAAVCDAVIASERFARELAPLVARSLDELLALGPQAAVVTLADDGAVGKERGRDPAKVEALSVQALDSTGAGDVYRGAFAYAWLAGLPFKERMRFASAAAGLKCRSYGAREGIPSLAAVEEALAEG